MGAECHHDCTGLKVLFISLLTPWYVCRITIPHGTFGHLSCHSAHVVLSNRATCAAVGISVTFCVHYGSSRAAPILPSLPSYRKSTYICSYFSINLDFECVWILFRLASAPTPPPVSCYMEPYRTVYAPTLQKACRYSNRIKIFDWTCQFNRLVQMVFHSVEYSAQRMLDMSWCISGSQHDDCNIRQVCERSFWVVKKYQAGLQNMSQFPEGSFGKIYMALWSFCQKIKTQTLTCHKVSVVEAKFIS
jgi:hypothetical protein